MQRTELYLILISSLILSACAQEAATSDNVEPAHIEPIGGEADLYRVILTERAFERLDIQTSSVREEEVQRTRRIGGEVVEIEALAGANPGIWVRVPLIVSELDKVDRELPALVFQLAVTDQASGLPARPARAPFFEPSSGALYYRVDEELSDLFLGERVLVEVALLGGGVKKVIPYAAVIYDLNGETWSYTRTEPLSFVRHSITVDYIDGDLAILSEGPEVGTEVVTVGVAELWGTEIGVGGHK